MNINNKQIATAVISGLIVAAIIYSGKRAAKAVVTAVNPLDEDNLANQAFEQATGGPGVFVDRLFRFLNPEAAAIEDSINEPVTLLDLAGADKK